MPDFENNQVIRLVYSASDWDAEVSASLIDRQAAALSPNTIEFYRKELRWFADSADCTSVEQVTAKTVRSYLVEISARRNQGGLHCAFRALRAFFNWYEVEIEEDSYINPMRKVKAPKVGDEPLEPISLDDLRTMLKQCPRKTFTGSRDRCILLGLLDTGCRASEFTALNMSDLNLSTGALLIREGKGKKFRTVFLGTKCRRELTRYLRFRRGTSVDDALWVSAGGKRLTPCGLREIMRRRAGKAEVPIPSLHSFRRAFALACLRSGMDLISLQRLMGHADLTVLRRYLAQTADDLGAAHAKHGPVDGLL